ncbi:hypothetical protein CC86DRAFT_39060 [Ophiobolus disseminans]|uniref:Uncharacterized protein n=1 Tax=Ophiobolus disseminans TaxID=1469910 RepID=A0A6A6ZXH0_9PLEO|nr:hypothetical protein CC86DRAFT_39060 [Ophiobolus disseminans]
MASADDAQSRPKRPTPMQRQSSSQSHVSQSPSEGHPRPAQHKAHRHVVSARVQRNASFGKNLNKLNKAAQQVQQAQQAADKEARHHRRSGSGNSVSAPSSPRPSFKRNASSGGIVRANHQAHLQANLRKNHSSGHLARQGQTKPSKKALAHPRSRPTSPEAHPAVHFDVASDDEEGGGDDGWTEESASQSPTTTRSNTRSNSVILDAQHKLAERNMESNRGEPSQAGAARQPPAQTAQTLPDRTRHAPPANGGGTHHSRPPDADMITSRLLQRSASHTVPPQTTAIEATVESSKTRHTVLSHSAGSTLVDTPGRDLVSRFMDGDGSAGTPHDGGYMTARKSARPGSGDLDPSKRNKSMPNVGGADTPNRTPSRSGATTPTNLPPSRTQQKLMLQRASSNIEPQKLVPVTLPRTGGPTFLQSGIHYNANGEGRLDPRLQQQFNHVEVEYNVVRRYRNPLADSIIRIQQIPGVSRKTRIPRTGSANGTTTPSTHGASSLSTSFNEAGIETDGASSRRSARVSFDNEHGRPRSRRDDGDVEGRQSFESDSGRSGSEAEDICRRLWESAEIIEAD